MELCNCCEGRTKKPFRFASALSALPLSFSLRGLGDTRYFHLCIIPLSYLVALTIFNIGKVLTTAKRNFERGTLNEIRDSE